ncbi:hypothetical protein [Polymorphospora rubra]|uniref:Uncharacterized protein n=1 Tax=Polymorphospora rubra TaxID=338584 RepID=A0A810N2K8_9ACTN|nr:hypothetical protein [Polymorphospora rubra]BCJ67891.1 hypothetical protein Prubr_49120 [Polymorphospora rubra]
MDNRRFRTIASFGAGIAVLVFGIGGSEEGRPSGAIFVLAGLAALIVWSVTKPAAGDKK